MWIQGATTDPGRAAAALAATGALALVVAACGGAAATPEATVPDAVEESVEATESAAPTPVVTSAQVGQDAWFAGFKVSLGEATAEITEGRGGTVTIDTVFENTGSDDATLDATLNLSSAGENATEGLGMDIPRVPGGASGKGTLAFDVEDSFTFDDAVLTLGRSGNQQAVIPLTSTAGTPVTLEPMTVAATGSGTAGDLRIDLHGGEFRADRPWNHGQMEDGSLALTLNYDATFEKDFAGGFAFAGDNVALRLPDGTTVGVIQDGRSQSIELIGAKSTVKDLYSRFEIDDPAPGEYAFLVRSFDNAEDEIPFTIP